jgi:cytochrome c-type biogenesis protein CcmE
MDPARKRRTRLVVALTAALLLAGALVYTSFSASSEAVQPSTLASKTDGRTYQLTGKVVDGSIRKQGDTVRFRVRDREGTASVPVSYKLPVPDPFKDGREIIVKVRRQGATFVGERDSLITKCPSKFTEKNNQAAT